MRNLESGILILVDRCVLETDKFLVKQEVMGESLMVWRLSVILSEIEKLPNTW